MGLSLSGSPVLVVFLMALCVGVGFWFYKRTNPEISVRIRILLTCFRSAALALVLLLIFTPVLRIQTHRIRKPAVGLLIDNSGSMRLSDRSVPRNQTVAQILKSQEIARLAHETDLHNFLFSSELSPVQDIESDSILFSGYSTDIARALLEIQKQMGDDILRGLLIISDGNYN